MMKLNKTLCGLPSNVTRTQAEGASHENIPHISLTSAESVVDVYLPASSAACTSVS